MTSLTEAGVEEAALAWMAGAWWQVKHVADVTAAAA